MNKKVSVIIPVYKVERYLDECIESVINQTYSNLEIIIVDDGSPDNCPIMCDEWGKRDNRIKVIHKENGGLSDARNAGMKCMSGDYVLFVDSDDFLELEMIEELVNQSAKYDCDIVMCNKTIVTTLRREKELDDGSVQMFTGNDIVENYLYHRNDFCSGIWNKLIRMDIIKGLEFPVGLNSEDYYMYSFIYFKATKMVKYNKALYNYRIRKGSICRSGINEQSFCKIKVAKLAEENLLEQGYTNRKAIKNFRMQSYHDVLNDMVEDGSRPDLIKKFKKKLRKYYWGTMFDKNHSIRRKIKMTLFCIVPVGYTKMKKLWLNVNDNMFE